jgi:DNA-directed RNA polymerase subunit beta'
VDSEMLRDVYEVPEDGKVLVDDGQPISAGTPLVSYDQTEVVADHAGRAFFDSESGQVVVGYERREEREYEVPSASMLLVDDGDYVAAGQQLTEGVNINNKHFELIVRKMMSRVIVTASGDSDFLPGELIDRLDFSTTNDRLAQEGKDQARAREVLLGISKAALSTDSFLSAASFQHTIRILAEAAVAGEVDELRGLKENVILGKLIPAGTGFRARAEREARPAAEMERVEEFGRGVSAEEEELAEELLEEDLELTQELNTEFALAEDNE